MPPHSLPLQYSTITQKEGNQSVYHMTSGMVSHVLCYNSQSPSLRQPMNEYSFSECCILSHGICMCAAFHQHTADIKSMEIL